jgi:transposase-like protein
MSTGDRRHAADARAEQIRLGVQQSAVLYAQAVAEEDWAVMGYASVRAWSAGEFGMDRFSAERRHEIVALLTQAGWTQRRIAVMTGASQATVKRDQRAARESGDSPDGTVTSISPRQRAAREREQARREMLRADAVINVDDDLDELLRADGAINVDDDLDDDNWVNLSTADISRLQGRVADGSIPRRHLHAAIPVQSAAGQQPAVADEQPAITPVPAASLRQSAIQHVPAAQIAIAPQLAANEDQIATVDQPAASDHQIANARVPAASLRQPAKPAVPAANEVGIATVQQSAVIPAQPAIAHQPAAIHGQSATQQVPAAIAAQPAKPAVPANKIEIATPSQQSAANVPVPAATDVQIANVPVPAATDVQIANMPELAANEVQIAKVPQLPTATDEKIAIPPRHVTGLRPAESYVPAAMAAIRRGLTQGQFGVEAGLPSNSMTLGKAWGIAGERLRALATPPGGLARAIEDEQEQRLLGQWRDWEDRIVDHVRSSGAPEVVVGDLLRRLADYYQSLP